MESSTRNAQRKRYQEMGFSTIHSFSEIINQYDGFILDQYGVMHNGSHALPGSIECIRELKDRGKKLIVLSNTSSPSAVALRKLPKLGFNKEWFVGAVTSGEEASRYIQETYGSGRDEKVKKAIWFTWEKDDVPLAFLEKCGSVEGTTNVEEADFIIAHGSQVLRHGGRCNDVESDSIDQMNVSLGSFMDDGDLSSISPILSKCLARNLPMVNANPDHIVKLPGDITASMPGKISKHYEEMGGECRYFGKPHGEHFRACLRELGLDRTRVCHVGDSLSHDVKGANGEGIDSIFITGGIHNDYFKDASGECGLPERSLLEKLFEEEGIVPTYVSPLLRF